jgi:hypothetical protein
MRNTVLTAHFHVRFFQRGVRDFLSCKRLRLDILKNYVVREFDHWQYSLEKSNLKEDQEMLQLVG